ncbi:MAG: hypothetical protein A2203_06995 [Chromatiales bacterium RIFOXYA1_FULL_46_5]|nr:MAG: hypothetical protein A2203_06995 [Chromatiales bacterium RIFOXYA1_FULL_46_5]
MNQSIQIREATAKDIYAMHKVRLAVRENTLSRPDRITEQDYLDAQDKLGKTWLIEIEQQVVAFATGYRDGSIWALFVDPDHEGQGYARALHQHMISWLWSLGHQRLTLTTEPNTRAEGFYLAQGWQAKGLTSEGEMRFELQPAPVSN